MLLVLKHTFGFKTRIYKYAWIGTIILTVLTGLAATVVDIAQCIPVEKVWYPTSAGTCLDAQMVVISTNAALGATSVVILALAFFQMMFGVVLWKHRALMFLCWILGML